MGRERRRRGRRNARISHRSRKYNLEARKLALRAHKISTKWRCYGVCGFQLADSMKPLAGECRLGKYNFRIVRVILLYEHIFSWFKSKFCTWHSKFGCCICRCVALSLTTKVSVKVMLVIHVFRHIPRFHLFTNTIFLCSINIVGDIL